MAIQKRWSYSQITKTAEEEILRCMDLAGGADTAVARMLYQARAEGVYNMWYELTCGWQNDGDSRRMRALTEQANA
ncbi:hypothetical protein [Burkholderia sp. KJ006]|uniref:hypothetical protein n=1 Tax=Burkholderia sp. KJ006 TaxID=416344 RepID=UPI0005A1F649|nr:hypothetical protein [Burkholderia sp. KJ006]